MSGYDEQVPHPTGEREGGAQDGPVIRDKRRIDPETGQLRDGQPREQGRSPEQAAPAPAAGAADPGAGAEAGAAPGPHVSGPDVPGDEVASLRQQLAERTADVQRLQAEYTNYRRRVDRDREVVRETAVANVLANLLPVLDDVGRARQHGELEGGFKAVAESLEAVVQKLGLEQYGEAGEPFDPVVHEALMHSHSDEVSETTCVQVLQPGYRLGERILRPARVAVAEPQG